MIILLKKTFSSRSELNDLLIDYIKEEKRQKRKKETLYKLRDFINDPKKVGLSLLGTGAAVTAGIVGGKKLKKKINEKRSNERVKKSILGEEEENTKISKE